MISVGIHMLLQLFRRMKSEIVGSIQRSNSIGVQTSPAVRYLERPYIACLLCALRFSISKAYEEIQVRQNAPS